MQNSEPYELYYLSDDKIPNVARADKMGHICTILKRKKKKKLNF